MTVLKHIALALVLAAAWSPSVTRAAAPEGRVNAQLFMPTEDDGKFILLGDSSILPLWDVRTSFFMNYAHEPLLAVNSYTGEKSAILGSLTTGDFMVAVGLHEVVEASLALPMSLSNGNDPGNGETFSATAPGDMRLKAKVQILSSAKYPIGLSVAPLLTMPTGDEEHFLGNQGLTGGAVAAVDYRIPGWFTESPVTLGANLGMLGRKSIPTGQEVLGSELNYGLGANVPIDANVEWITDLHGRAAVSAPFARQSSSPLELLMAIRSLAFRESHNLTLTGGAGAGLTNGMGSPAFRLFAGVQYAFVRPIDTDADSYADKKDLCPTEPEDFDYFQDDDGCPEKPVTYRGQVVAAGSRKPLNGKVRLDPPGSDQPYTEGYFEIVTEASGPHLFTIFSEGYEEKSLSIVPAPGAVSNVAAELLPYPMKVLLSVTGEGKPLDGLVEVVPEMAQYNFAAGALQFDVDAMTERRALRVSAEGFQPLEKGIVAVPGGVTTVTVSLSPLFKSLLFKAVVVDSATEAPVPVTAFVGLLAKSITAENGRFSFEVKKPGDYDVMLVSNGYEPQVFRFPTAGTQPAEYAIRMVRKQVKVVAQKLELDPIFFKENKADILANSFPILEAVAEYLTANPQVRLRIEGHTDDKGNDKKNLMLSQKRVDSVVRYLIKKGVAGERLKPRGFGETQPIAPNDSEENRAKNRRVEFILDEKTE